MLSDFAVQHSPSNLRAYRQAERLAADVFWQTRHCGACPRDTITRELRHLASALPDLVARAWTFRHDMNTWDVRIERALQTLAQLGHWLNVAHACDHVTPAVHSRLLDQQQETLQAFQRLRQRQRLVTDDN